MSAVAHIEPEPTYHSAPPEPMIWHEYANLFPLLEGEAFWSLVEDVRANGVREPIVMYEGRVLDGRNRYLAAREAKVPYPVVQYDGDDALAFVVSLNLKRRHLNESQRAMAAAKIAQLPAHRPADGNSANLRTSDAAQMLSVSTRSVESARAVQRDGTPALVASVDTGNVTVSAAAEVAKLPEGIQTEVVAADAVSDVAREIRETDAATVTARLQAGDPKARADVQSAIRSLVSRPASTPKPAEAPVVDDPAFRAMATVAGAANTIIETLAANGAPTIVAGFLDAAMRRRNVETFVRCRDALTAILEACDAA